jgi:hypothetical protein
MHSINQKQLKATMRFSVCSADFSNGTYETQNLESQKSLTDEPLRIV